MRTREDPGQASIILSFEARTFYVHRLFPDLMIRLRLPIGALPIAAKAAKEHGRMRRLPGDNIPMLIEESRFLQVSVFDSLREHLKSGQPSLVLLSIMTIADEVDSQLKQMVESYQEAAQEEFPLPAPFPLLPAALNSIQGHEPSSQGGDSFIARQPGAVQARSLHLRVAVPGRQGLSYRGTQVQ